LPYWSGGTIGEGRRFGAIIRFRYQKKFRLSWRNTMPMCIALITLMMFNTIALAAIAPADTLTEDSNTVTAIKDFLTEITEGQLEITNWDDEVELRSVEFSYADSDFEQVSLAASFTGWVRIPMKKQGGIWTLTIAVPANQQHYRFSVTDQDETWQAIDPDNPTAINHSDYGWVSILASDGHEENRDSEARKSKRRERRNHRRFVTQELEFGQGISQTISYQRVDGLVINPSVTRVNEKDGYDASVRLHGNYGFSSGRFGGGLTFLQPLIRSYILNLKLSLFDRTMPNNYFTGIGKVENSLAALFLHEDYHDYHRSKGVNASLVFKLGKWLRLECGVRKEDHTSLGTPSIWSFKKGEFSLNPVIDEGRMRSVFFNLGVGGKNTFATATYERAGDGVLGGDFEFERITAQLRGRLELGRDSGFNVGLAEGSHYRGQLPGQRRFLLGGLGTVRGDGYQSLLIEDPDSVSNPDDTDPYGGQRNVLGNVEYYFHLADDFHMSLFYDAGMVWQDRQAELAWDQLKTSAGLGFNFDSTDGPRLDLIKPLDDPDNAYVIQFRLKRSF